MYTLPPLNTTSGIITSVFDTSPLLFRNCIFRVLGSFNCSVGIATLYSIFLSFGTLVFAISSKSALGNPCDFINVFTELTRPDIGFTFVNVIFAIATWF